MKELFSFSIFEPIILHEGISLSKVLSELYDMDIYPMIIDKKNKLYRMALENNPYKGANIICVIIPFRYEKEFLA